jgi:glycerol kinase
MQMQADILGTPVLISANEEATALGAATCAGVGSGLFSNLGEGGEALASFTKVAAPLVLDERSYLPVLLRCLDSRTYPTLAPATGRPI